MSDHKPPQEMIPDAIKNRLLIAARGRPTMHAAAGCTKVTLLMIPELLLIPIGIVALSIFGVFGYLLEISAKTTVFLIIPMCFLVGVIILLKSATRSKQTDIWKKQYCPEGKLPSCVQCEYDLRGSPATCCPECGEEVFVFK